MMTSVRDEPLYNLKAVVQQTGLKPDTLRAWERRYGMPTPERSKGGHRLYSRRDIEIIRWLIGRQREGLNISRAIELWEQLEESGQDPLRVAPPIAPSMPTTPLVGFSGETLAELRDHWSAACLRYDERQAEQVLAQAFALYPPEVVVVHLIQRAVSEIGEGWYRGEVTVQQEHFCSALAMRHLEALVMAAPSPTRPGRILAGCPPMENHSLGLLVLTFLLRRSGWELVYLGADVPAERLETTIAATEPQLVILSAQQLHTAASLLGLSQILRREGIPLAYGGLIFNLVPAIRERIPGHFLGEQLDQAPQAVERLMSTAVRLPAAEPVSEAYLQAREHFRGQKRLIDAELAQEVADLGMVPWQLAMVNRELGDNIEAVLVLGNMDYLLADLDWVRGLLSHRGLPDAGLTRYLQAYRRAAAVHLDERGSFILRWFDQILNGS
ncbi:MAG: MerR family transcriptional regulator [Anaerolineae bacterium]